MSVPDGYSTTFLPDEPDNWTTTARRRNFASVEPRAVRWLVPRSDPPDTSTAVAGIGGLGKPMYLLALAAQVSRGDLAVGASSVIVVSSVSQ